MKRNTLLFLVTMLVASMLVTTASAKNGVEYRANGKLVSYDPPQVSSEVVNGHWSISVKDGSVDFKAFYRERNLGESEMSPCGSIDEFWISLDRLESVQVNLGDGSCSLTGDFVIKKKWWVLPGYYDYPPRVEWLRGETAWHYYGDVTVNPVECFLWFFGGVNGPTLAIQY